MKYKVELYKEIDYTTPIATLDSDDKEVVEKYATENSSVVGLSVRVINNSEHTEDWYADGLIVEYYYNDAETCYSFHSDEARQDFIKMLNILRDPTQVEMLDMHFEPCTLGEAFYLNVYTKDAAEALDEYGRTYDYDTPYYNDHFESVCYTTDTLGAFMWVSQMSSFVNVDECLTTLTEVKEKLNKH